MTKSATVSINIASGQGSPPPPAPAALASLQLLAETLSPSLGTPVSFQVLALGTDGLSLASTPFSVEINGQQTTSGTTGPDGTAHFALTFSQYGNYAAVAKSGQIASNTVSLSIPQPPPPPPTPQSPSTAVQISGANTGPDPLGSAFCYPPIAAVSLGSVTLSQRAVFPGSVFQVTYSAISIYQGIVPHVELELWGHDDNPVSLGGGDGISGTISAQIPAGLLTPPTPNGYGDYGLVLKVTYPYQDTTATGRLRTYYYGPATFYDSRVDLSALPACGIDNLGLAQLNGFYVTIPKPVITLKDGGQISAQLNVSTRRIFISVQSDAGAIAGLPVTLVNQNLSGLGSVTTDATGNAYIDVTFGSGSMETLTAFSGHYPALYPQDLVSQPIQVGF